MAHNNIEIEIKVQVNGSEKLVQFLEENGTFQSEGH